jgi:hypothetical protein
MGLYGLDWIDVAQDREQWRGSIKCWEVLTKAKEYLSLPQRQSWDSTVGIVDLRKFDSHLPRYAAL